MPHSGFGCHTQPRPLKKMFSATLIFSDTPNFFYCMIFWDPPLMKIYGQVTALQRSCITLCGIFSKKFRTKIYSAPKVFEPTISLDQKYLDPKCFVDPNFLRTHDFFWTRYLFGNWTLQLEMRDKAFPS